jgi:hypothetical protein
LVRQTLLKITQLPKDEQIILNPNWLASCYQKVGNFPGAREILTEVQQISPDDPLAVAALAEMALLDRSYSDALALTESLRRRPESQYQVLGRMYGAVALWFQGFDEPAAREFSWIGHFLISNGSVGPMVWDYGELRQLLANPTIGRSDFNRVASNLLLNVITGKMPFPDFTQAWGAVSVRQP